MNFHLASAEVYIPDQEPEEAALHRTTHLCFAAHQDDIEIMAAQPILECFQQPDKWFTGVIVTDGRGSPRAHLYEHYSDEEMRLVRFKEQRKAALVGEFAAQVMLDIPSKVIKDASRPEPVADVVAVLRATQPNSWLAPSPTKVCIIRVGSAKRSFPSSSGGSSSANRLSARMFARSESVVSSPRSENPAATACRSVSIAFSVCFCNA